MTITSADIYWLTRLDAIKSIAISIGILCVLSGAASLILYCIRTWAESILNPDTNSSGVDTSAAHCAKTATARLRKVAIPVFLVTLVIWVGLGLFVPTTKEYAAIRVVPVVLNNTVLSNTAKEDFGELYTLSMEWAKDELRIIKPDVKEAVTNGIKGVINDTVKSVTE